MQQGHKQVKVILPEICHNVESFQALVDFCAQTANCRFEQIVIDMGGTTWFDADMCAAFGAILHNITCQVNAIRLENIQPQVEKILSKNGFLSHYGHERIPDRWETTVSYERFDAKDERYFADYVENELVRRKEIPSMSDGMRKKFRESIFEVFSNAVLHSRTERGIFSCGQFFPKRNALTFSVADLGIGMRQNVRENVGLDFSAVDAIDWATREHNTTKRGPIPGGLGLKLLVEFIGLNGGSVQIVSDAGYWRRKDEQTSTMLLRHPFPGTVVTLEINTADEKSYALQSELPETNIF